MTIKSWLMWNEEALFNWIIIIAIIVVIRNIIIWTIK